MTAYTVADFDFDLPQELIAQHPTPERSASRLLDGRALPATERVFRELPDLLSPDDLLVFNDTRVIRARLHGAKDTGGSVEALVERVLPGTEDGRHEVWAHLRASKSPRAGQTVHFHNAAGGRFAAEVLGRCGPENGLFHLRLPGDALTLLEQFGHVPLPPYITHADDEDDARRYQTVFARVPGAVAAPTAALHFDEGVLAALEARGVRRASVTLHVGAGTFQPVRVESISDHRMHSEWFEVPQATVDAIAETRARGGRVIAVGTTTLRSLESAAQGTPDRLPRAGARDTDIFITPGFDFRVVDQLVTNFHLPRSTLMMLVSAFAGFDAIRTLYADAIARRMRFFSYGDSMLLQRAASAGNDGDPSGNSAVPR
ncbi:MAG: tRNA preQ1(34) S-adenosylmethionine ribosyltransferase-isomerase QueA [Sphaerotilus natans subsp. sulfidivorans]|uniref:tRNA preQ1(34) S-adenosylmethionine ribosyltransferase-isomerase QueA n=1 Tax=Sphaerotilus sulfidivorans TaxID=639200 RepID=UPI002353F99A|nr:tRNA preQ1(34) S-adenosylmethionine ribosyltransferase-isomerase QueA [Sphaerotilus sulfidivorans]MCK6400631.1 tRNA preQ1(34) S-adenosylmethionine ribosyltransferase-isomerase QueA [Sphaerotilus sulfidivorans]